MSAAAIQLLNHLREGGVENERAVKIAEAFDLRVKEALEDAKAHADRNRAEIEAQAKTQFVAADEYHARDKTLATRADLHENAVALRAESPGCAPRFAPNSADSTCCSSAGLSPCLSPSSAVYRYYRQTLFWGLRRGLG